MLPTFGQKVKTQAIVVIHGMGEQRPNVTLRGFVKCLVKKVKTLGQPMTIYDKPDRVSGSYETRKMVMTRSPDKSRPTTHVYEFYWAHHMRDTTYGEVVSWVLKLLLKWPWKVPRRLLKVFLVIWALLIAIAVVYFVYYPFKSETVGSGVLKWLVSLPWIATVGGLLLRLVGSTAVLKVLGDAARYMSDSPDNIEQRQKIREEGVSLLRDLHTAADENGTPDYDRIIVVSHSLGTVVAYDLLRLLWTEMSDVYDKTIDPGTQPALDALEKAGVALSKPLVTATKTPLPDSTAPVPAAPVTLDDFRACQVACGNEQRSLGNKWRITDLLTLGSPLAYTDYMIFSSKEEFAERKEEKEYPTCPPVPDVWPKFLYRRRFPSAIKDPNSANSATGTNVTKDGFKETSLLNYSSLYGCIRWTNLYFSTDYVGGPMQPMLGRGIKDVRLPPQGPWIIPYPFGHTDYWKDKECEALESLWEALDLHCNPPEPKKPDARS